MKCYPNYRVAVEALIVRDGKVFLAKRADNCEVAPGKWNVPAGKVKYEEIPAAAVVREAMEETKLEVEVVAEVGVRAFKFEHEGKDAFRLVYTYHVRVVGERSEPEIDDEHSECVWVSSEELDLPEYASLDGQLKECIRNILTDK